jgi:hypothetical protein
MPALAQGNHRRQKAEDAESHGQNKDKDIHGSFDPFEN